MHRGVTNHRLVQKSIISKCDFFKSSFQKPLSMFISYPTIQYFLVKIRSTGQTQTALKEALCNQC